MFLLFISGFTVFKYFPFHSGGFVVYLFIYLFIAFVMLMSHKISTSHFSIFIIFFFCIFQFIFMCFSFTLVVFSLRLFFILIFKNQFFLCSYSSLSFPILLPLFLFGFSSVLPLFLSSVCFSLSPSSKVRSLSLSPLAIFLPNGKSISYPCPLFPKKYHCRKIIKQRVLCYCLPERYSSLVICGESA